MVDLIIFIFGLAVGSFLNVCIDRLSFEQSLMGRSHCDHCKKKLGWQDLVPVFSWLYLGGKSRCCGKKISAWYPVVEIITGVAFVLIWNYLPHAVILRGEAMKNLWQMPGIRHLWEILRVAQDEIVKIFYLGIISALIVIFFADLKYHIIPDEATITIVIFSIITALLQGQILEKTIGGIVLFLILYSLFFITRGRGMGFGDVKYAAAMGLILGLKNGLIGIYLSFVLGGVVSILLILLNIRGLKSKIAFGPFLIFGTVVMWFWSEFVVSIFHQYFPYI